MSIDGIGSGGKPPSVGGPGGGRPVERATGESFGVDRAEPAAPAERSEPLARLQRGEITLDQYLDTRVESATRHLEAKLPSAELGFVRETLRGQLRTDPVLLELVRRTTGALPSDVER